MKEEKRFQVRMLLVPLMYHPLSSSAELLPAFPVNCNCWLSAGVFTAAASCSPQRDNLRANLS